jgi:host factor-I protein
MRRVKGQNLQDVFLNHLRKNKIPVTMFLVKGVKLAGHRHLVRQFLDPAAPRWPVAACLQACDLDDHARPAAFGCPFPGRRRRTARSACLQEVFLSSVRDAGVQVTMFLVNGVMLQGKVAAYDLFCMLLEREGYVQLAYKHAVSTIQPAGHVDLTGDWEGEAN